MDSAERLAAVLAHIEAHLDAPLDIPRLAAVAAWSPFHFHRQFSAAFALGTWCYVQLLRLKRATWALAFRPARTVTDIALEAGYDSPEAFSRAFRRHTGQSPSAFRAAPDWASWQAAFAAAGTVRRQHMRPHFRLQDVTVVAFPETRVALLAHRGDPGSLPASITRFIAWRRENHLPPALSATFNIAHDDPQAVAPADFRMDLCAATGRAIAPNPQGVVAGVIPGGRCARLRHTGPDEGLEAAARFLYGEWLPQSGEALRDYPLFLQRVRFFPDVPESEAVIDLFLPLA
jgi:AraC family transcriptional regulator